MKSNTTVCYAMSCHATVRQEMLYQMLYMLYSHDPCRLLLRQCLCGKAASGFERKLCGVLVNKLQESIYGALTAAIKQK